jgi:hypothetical protein
MRCEIVPLFREHGQDPDAPHRISLVGRPDEEDDPQIPVAANLVIDSQLADVVAGAMPE